MNVLITGVAGFIGSNLAKVLLQEGHSVYGVDNFITSDLSKIVALQKFGSLLFFQGDIRNFELRNKLMDFGYDHIYHLACPTGVPNIQKYAEEMLATCSVGTLNVLEIARACNAKLIYSSSSEVYGEPLVSPQSEEYTGNVSTTGPRSPYEEGKRFSEALVMMYVRKYGLDAKIARFFNIYGPGMATQDTRVLPRFMLALSNNQPLEIYGDGQQKRTFLFVSDLLVAIRLVIDQGKPGQVYNIGSETEITIKQLAETLLGLIGSIQTITYKPHFIADHSFRHPALDLIKNLGWSETVSLKQGLGQVLLEYVHG